jgi:uncharacterized damage-inducible protein DinB
MPHDEALRDQLVALLDWRGAHATFDDAVAGLLLEHLRLAQRDILDFCRDPHYAEPHWPDDYWPDTTAPPDDDAWDASVAQFHADLQAMQALVGDPATDLFRPIPHGDGQTILREAVLLADHNAYHVGQIVVVRRLLGCWPAAK